MTIMRIHRILIDINAIQKKLWTEWEMNIWKIPAVIVYYCRVGFSTIQNGHVVTVYELNRKQILQEKSTLGYWTMPVMNKIR